MHRPLSLIVPLVLLLTAGCASGPVERGWLGGRFADVRRGEPALVEPRTDAPGAPCDVQGLPHDVEAPCGLLVLEVPDATPAAASGLAAGDLIVRIDGDDVDGADALDARVRGLAPGATLELTVWRDGATSTLPVTVGTETVERGGFFRLGLVLHGALDLWPFDGDFDVLGLVRLRSPEPRTDLHDVRADYVAGRGVARSALAPPRTTFEVSVVPLGFGRTERVTSQSR